MADLKTLQKKIATLLYQQLSQYFNQVQIISYKPSSDGSVSGKFTGDRRNYTFILKNNQVQYLPSTAKMDSTALAVRPRQSKGLAIQCTGSNHPCRGEKGTRCVPQNQSCKQRESSDEGIARLKDISATSKEITALVTGKTVPVPKNKTAPEAKNTKPSPDAPELDQDISLYDFLKYYSPWRPEGSKGFENAKLRDVRRRGVTKKVKQGDRPDKTESRLTSDPQVKTEREPRAKTTEATQPKTKPDGEAANNEPKRTQSRQESNPPKTKPDDPNPKGLNAPKQNQSNQSRSQTNQSKQESTPPKTPPKQSSKTNNPYEFLGVSPQDFPDEASLYKAAKIAYKNLAIKYHPDKGGDPEMMQQLNSMMDRLKSIENIRRARERGDSRLGFNRKRRAS